MLTSKGTVPVASCICTSGAFSGGGSLTSTRRRQRLTKWSHPLSLAERSALTRAWNVGYQCCPCLMRSDTASTRRRACPEGQQLRGVGRDWRQRHGAYEGSRSYGEHEARGSGGVSQARPMTRD